MIKFIALGGFLGAGKTTTMIALAKALQAQSRRVAVVTNDQGVELVDTKLVRSQLDAVAEVTGGCFCCRFEDLTQVVAELVAGRDLDTVIAEAVGSCTDLQATVVRPLRTYYGDRFTVAPLVTVVDPFRLRAFARAEQRGEPESDLSYLFGRQLAEADVIALNKVDMVDAADRDRALASLNARYPAATVVPYSARTGACLRQLLDLLDACDDTADRAGDLAVDYNRYAAAEAGLAWLNQSFHLQAAGDDVWAQRWGSLVLASLATFAEGQKVQIGHVKLTVETPAGLTKMSITGNGMAPTVDVAADDPARPAMVAMAGMAGMAGMATINARVECAPHVLDRAVLAAVAEADAAIAVRSTAAAPANSFQPAYPRPVHRLTAASTRDIPAEHSAGA
jgi:G3E family GTPase